MRIGYQGIPGSYSESAALQYLKLNQIRLEDAELIGMDTFIESTNKLLAGEIDLAVMPIENSTTGLITRTLDLFRYQPVAASAEIYEQVQHTLWGVEGSRIEDIKEVYSHPEALSQTANFFEEYPHIQPVTYIDTAQSAKYIKELGDPTKAALASQRAGELYELIPLRKSIQAEKTNTTRFFIMEKIDEKMEIGDFLRESKAAFPERTRMMLYVETAHTPGALAQLLNTFNLFNCNLEGLDARPIKDKPFNYGFFIEVDLAEVSINPTILWKTLAHSTEYIQLIGLFEPKQLLMNYL